jgi:hypothetical protein
MLKLFSGAKYLNFNIYKLAVLITMGHKKRPEVETSARF